MLKLNLNYNRLSLNNFEFEFIYIGKISSIHSTCQFLNFKLN